MKERYWENQSGYYDSTLAKVIESENYKENKARNKQVHDTIQEIKNILNDRDFELLERIKLKDKVSKKVYK